MTKNLQSRNYILFQSVNELIDPNQLNIKA